MMLVLLQGTFTPLAHAHAGRTPGAQADKKRDGFGGLHRLCLRATLRGRRSFLRLSLAVMPPKSSREASELNSWSIQLR